MATIKTANSVKIEQGTIYTHNGTKGAKEQLWWDLPVNQDFNPQNEFTKFYAKTKNFDEIHFKYKKGAKCRDKNVNNSNNYIDKNNPNCLILDGGNGAPATDTIYHNKTKTAIFWMNTDSKGKTTYEFAGIFTKTYYVKSSNLNFYTKISDDLECTF